MPTTTSTEVAVGATSYASSPTLAIEPHKIGGLSAGIGALVVSAILSTGLLTWWASKRVSILFSSRKHRFQKELPSLAGQADEKEQYLHSLEKAVVVNGAGTSTAIANAIPGSTRFRKAVKKERTIWTAAFDGQIKEVEDFLQKGIDVNATDTQYGTPLQAAAQGGAEEAAKVLLEQNADIDASSGDYGTALQIASNANNISLTKLLLYFKARVDLRTATLSTPLQIACHHGFSDLALSLLASGASVNVRDEQGRTPLHDATRLGRVDLAKALIKAGVKVNAQDDDLFTALHYAAGGGYDAVADLLLKEGADIAIQDKFQAHALFRAAGRGSAKIVTMLLDKDKTLVDHPDCFGQTALHGPPEANNVEVPSLLLQYGADINKKGHFNRTPMHQHADAGNIWSVKLLLSRKEARPEAQDSDQATPLHYAVKYDYQELKEKRAVTKQTGDVDIIAGKSLTDDQYAWELVRRYEDIALEFIERMESGIEGRGGATLQEVIVRGSERVFNAMLKKGINLNLQGGPYGSAVGAAAFAGKVHMLKKLLQVGARHNIQGGEFGTPLQAAAWKGNYEAVKLLLERGVIINARGGRYGTAFTAAKKAMEDPGQRDANVAARQELIYALLRDNGGKDEPTSENENKRWKLTPGGWAWVPKGQF